MDFDSPELAEYPEIRARVTARDFEPGQIMIGERLLPIWDIPYTAMTKEFEKMGAQRVSRSVS